MLFAVLPAASLYFAYCLTAKWLLLHFFILTPKRHTGLQLLIGHGDGGKGFAELQKR